MEKGKGGGRQVTSSSQRIHPARENAQKNGDQFAGPRKESLEGVWEEKGPLTREFLEGRNHQPVAGILEALNPGWGVRGGNCIREVHGGWRNVWGAEGGGSPGVEFRCRRYSPPFPLGVVGCKRKKCVAGPLNLGRRVPY